MRYSVKKVRVQPFRMVPHCEKCGIKLESLGSSSAESGVRQWEYRCGSCGEKVEVHNDDHGIRFYEVVKS